MMQAIIGSDCLAPQTQLTVKDWKRARCAVRLPCVQVELSRQTTLEADSMRLAVARERPAQIVLPTTEESDDDALSGVFKCAAAFGVVFGHLLGQDGYALHLDSPSSFV